MGNVRLRKMSEARERARRALAADVADLVSRQKRIEGALAEVWSSLEVRAVRAERRDARIAKLQATFDAGRAKAEAEYEADVTKIRDRYAVAVQHLRADGKTPAQISELTGLTPAEIREAQSLASAAADAPTRPEPGLRGDVPACGVSRRA